MPLIHIHHEGMAAAKPKKPARAVVKHRTKAAVPPPAPAPAPVEAAEQPPAPEETPAAAEAAHISPAQAFETRLAAARSRLQAQTPDDELPALLDQAITLLESVSQHPALRDYSATQRKLEEIEQRLASGAYPQ